MLRVIVGDGAGFFNGVAPDIPPVNHAVQRTAMSDFVMPSARSGIRSASGKSSRISAAKTKSIWSTSSTLRNLSPPRIYPSGQCRYIQARTGTGNS